MENKGIHTQPAEVAVISEPIKFDLGSNTCGVKIDTFTNADGEAVYRVLWTDYAVNEWNEYYSSLAVALMRVAMLTATVEHELAELDATLSFTNDSTTFAHNAQMFIQGEVK